MSVNDFIANVEILTQMLGFVILLLAGHIISIMTLTYPVQLFAKYIKQKNYKNHWKTLLIAFASLVVFNIITLLYGLVVIPLLDVDTGYESGFMFFMFILCVVPVSVILYYKNIKHVTK